MKDAKEYIPKMYPMGGKGRYIEFLLEGSECQLCKKNNASKKQT